MSSGYIMPSNIQVETMHGTHSLLARSRHMPNLVNMTRAKPPSPALDVYSFDSWCVSTQLFAMVEVPATPPLGGGYTMDHDVVTRFCNICDWLWKLSWDHFSLHQGNKKVIVIMEFEVPKRHISRPTLSVDMVQRVLQWERQEAHGKENVVMIIS